MNRLRWLPLALLATLAAPAAPAAERLTLSEAVRLAQARHPTVAAARARLAEARESAGEARAVRGPTVRALLAGQQHGDPVPVTPIHGFGPGELPEFDETLLQATLSGSYVLLDSGARRARVEQAAGLEAGSAAALVAAGQAIAEQVTATWAAIGARQRAVVAQTARRDALAAELERTRRLFEAGKVAEVESLRAEAGLAAADAERIRVATALDSAERDLARWIGADPEEARAPRLAPLAAATAPAEPRGELARRAADASPRVEQARRQLEAARAQHALARSAYFPELRTTAALQELGGADAAFGSEWNVALQLSVPLWDGGVTGRRVARAAAGVEGAAAALAQAELDAAADVDRALAALTEATARRAALESAEARLVEVARIQNLLLETGAGTQVDYLAAEAELASTRGALAEADGQTLAARAALARAAGELTPEWLAQHLEVHP
jgi:outer membrane protein TolC